MKLLFAILFLPVALLAQSTNQFTGQQTKTGGKLSNVIGGGGGGCSSSYVAAPAGQGTGNRTSSITITSLGGGGLALLSSTSGLIDGDTSGHTTFANHESGAGDYFYFDFGAGIIATEFRWYQSSASTSGTWKIQGSTDASTWTDIGSTFTLGGSTLQTITTVSANTTSYRYYRFLCTAGVMSGSTFFLEMEVQTCQ